MAHNAPIDFKAYFRMNLKSRNSEKLVIERSIAVSSKQKLVESYTNGA